MSLQYCQVAILQPTVKIAPPLEALRKMRINRGIVGCWMLVLIGLFSVRLSGQAVGTIVGTVTDPSGAVISQAKVTALKEDTHIAQTAVTTDAGTYAIPHLAVGVYTVSVDMTGFASKSVTGIMLDVS